MPNQKSWGILQRRNSDSLKMSVVTSSIPNYIKPVVRAFRIHHIFGEEAPESPPSQWEILEGGVVFFHLDIASPDDLPFRIRMIDWPTVNE